MRGRDPHALEFSARRRSAGAEYKHGIKDIYVSGQCGACIRAIPVTVEDFNGLRNVHFFLQVDALT